VRLLARGMPVKQIAAELGVSVRAIEHQKCNIMQALHVHLVLELVMKAEAPALLYQAPGARSAAAANGGSGGGRGGNQLLLPCGTSIFFCASSSAFFMLSVSAPCDGG
jgi:hypothetical protein